LHIDTYEEVWEYEHETLVKVFCSECGKLLRIVHRPRKRFKPRLSLTERWIRGLSRL